MQLKQEKNECQLNFEICLALNSKTCFFLNFYGIHGSIYGKILRINWNACQL